ncbi:PEP-CTERM sorting domain-containing protein [Novosphingobium sp. Gsoil 351]|uniref:PEP-CTERM sorting domain-containing protein n=1 Tax=Novosphingobium sp. Gsoil 351 TaxID=2675225 RepID=UPI0012B4F9C8|nr:PEP-CTERM sorting domain-containing protein [Novosphingobium sp. Gsoil 351]QGN56083.1 PEP-CTERM sorting domain-containing protein [Novosphingobium sp. Gsoil 351]
MESPHHPSRTVGSLTQAFARKNGLAVGILVALLFIGVTLNLIPSLRAGAVPVGQYAAKDVEDILTARSPGERSSGAILNKIKKAIGLIAVEDSPRSPVTNPKVVTRSRLIRHPSGPVDSEHEVIPPDISALLGPLAGLEETADAPKLGPLSAPSAFPMILIGDAGGMGGSSGGGQGSGGGLPTDEAPPVITPDTPPMTGPTPGPSSPVPEPSTWMIMIAGLSLTAAVLRRRRRIAALAV